MNGVKLDYCNTTLKLCKESYVAIQVLVPSINVVETAGFELCSVTESEKILREIVENLYFN